MNYDIFYFDEITGMPAVRLPVFVTLTLTWFLFATPSKLTSILYLQHLPYNIRFSNLRTRKVHITVFREHTVIEQRQTRVCLW